MLIAGRTAKTLIKIACKFLEDHDMVVKENEQLKKENAELQLELDKAQTYSRTVTGQNCELWFQVRALERKVKRFESGNS